MFPSRISTRAGLAALLSLQFFSPVLGQPSVGPATAGPPANLFVPGTACQAPSVEAAVLARETSVLGPAHAEDHARMRAQQCEVERGLRPVPAQGAARLGPATLQEDTAAVATANQIAAGSQMSVSAASARSAKTSGSQGRWSDPFIIPVVGVTAVVLHTGKVLFWSYDPATWGNPASSNTGVAYIWDPATRTGHSIAPPENIWCGGQTVIADGRVFVAGGNLRYPDPNATAGAQSWEGTLTSYTFIPATESFVKQPDMLRGRWYPTTTGLADNRVVITSGYDQTGSDTINNYVEIFTPSADPAGMGSIALAGTHNSSGLYPQQFLLSGGSVLEAGPAPSSSYVFNPAANQWTQMPAMLSSHWGYDNGIIYTDLSGGATRQVVMVAGGTNTSQSVTANEWLDGNSPAAGWRPFPQWLQPRHNSNTVILPDGKLLTVGGNRATTTYDNPLLEAEMYSTDATITSGKWQRMAAPAIQAAYHSSAVLLPDATVLLSQDDMDHSAAAAAQHKAQIYSPPYLFQGPRPTINTAPASVGHGQSFDVGTDRNVASAVLMAPGATTHGNDMHQRAIRLPVQLRSNGLTATIPGSAAIVPSGYYMLFVLDSSGTPSVAMFVRVV
ncbi:MAG TPA: galactose oxidase early set domain-containing protein [Ramlibacter sp.]|nr:galactose oxidase early set domain-containing protein [Ramlibacter sp.]